MRMHYLRTREGEVEMSTKTEPILTFDEQSHTYMLDGAVVPSVTQVLQGAGLIDDQWFTPASTHRGTYVHAMTAAYDKGVLDLAKVDDAYRGYLEAWKRFRFESYCKILTIEEQLSHAIYRYAGSLDRTAYLCGKYAVVDIKTGCRSHWHELQTAAYADCVGTPAVGPIYRFTVYLHDDGAFKLDSHDWNYRRDLDVFLAALAVTNWKGNG